MAKSFEELAKRTMTPEMRAEAKTKAAVYRAEILLSDLRKLSGKTQREVAKAMKMAPSNLSRLEKQDDIQWMTLLRLADAVNIKIDLVATLPDGKKSVIRLGKSRKARRAS